MNSIGWRALIIFGMSAIFLVMALLFYFLGYVAGTDWDNNAIMTTCNITNNQVKEDQCPYDCNCDDSTTSTQCQTCYDPCYDGYITVAYTDQNENKYSETIEVYSDQDSEDYVRNNLEKNYPVDSTVTCYYNKDDPTSVKLDLVNTQAYLIISIVLFCLVGLIWISWVLFELIKRAH